MILYKPENDIMLSHAGKQHSYKVAVSLENIGRLARFVTSTYYMPSRFPDSIFAKFKPLDKFFSKRCENDLSPDKVIRYPFFEIPEILLRGVVGNKRVVSDMVCARDALFDNFVAKTQLADCKIFWGFQGSCLRSLEAAGKRKITAIAEFSNAHVTAAIRILEEEKIKNPEWADSINNLYFPKWYIERLKKEPLAADWCVVESEFAKKTLEEAGISSGKILVLPLGTDMKKFAFKRREIKKPFQILFVGGVGQRKGIKYLLDAYEKIKSENTKLKIIGPVIGSGSAFRRRSDLYEYMGTLPHEEIVRQMHESDVLVLPSLVEGFGLVITEAMATGMPVIASRYSGAPEIIREGCDGFIIEPRDVNGMAARLEELAMRMEKTVEMGNNARERAEEFSWEKHTVRLRNILSYIENGK
ncbi:MAG: glycosyltransferase family 4 protein [Candidatus Omnitrophica bacterium]|nr:glycosyltransferase family 4 protein [Candidatus Omnitrophota bacterium]